MRSPETKLWEMTSELAIAAEVKPKCSYFGTCGGCTHQDLEYSTQLELKRKLVEEVLSDLNHSNPFQVHPTLPSPKPFRYRNMLSLTVRHRQGILRLGFMGRDSRSFVPVESCAIADERIDQFLPEALRRLEALPPKRRFHTSQIALRVGGEGEVVTSLRADRGRTLECTVLGKHFSYSVSSFFQNNFSVLDSFVRTIRSFLEPTGRGTLLDLYSGVGLLSILLADTYEQVIGIEEGYEAVQHAKRNAERNEVQNTQFLKGKVETLLPQLISEVRKPLHIIVDPPRAGLKQEVANVLAGARFPIERLIYVSCSLESLSRDLKTLVERFQIVSVQPIDLFPQTKHIETVLLLQVPMHQYNFGVDLTSTSERYCL